MFLQLCLKAVTHLPYYFLKTNTAGHGQSFVLYFAIFCTKWSKAAFSRQLPVLRSCPSFLYTSAGMARAWPVKLGWEQIGLFSKNRILHNKSEPATIRKLNCEGLCDPTQRHETALWDWVTAPSVPNLKQLKQALCPCTMQTAEPYLWKVL